MNARDGLLAASRLLRRSPTRTCFVGLAPPFLEAIPAALNSGSSVTMLTPPGGCLPALDGRVRVVPLPREPMPLEGTPALRQSYVVLDWLRRQDFDSIHFEERQGIGFYSLLARRQGLAFPQTALHVHVAGPTLYERENAGQLLDSLDLLEADALERACVRLADSLSVHPAIETWLRQRDWPTPTAPRIADPPLQTPLVSVCLVHHERPALLAQALESLRGQDYPKLEVILVDDGSTSPAALSCLQGLTAEFAQRGWQLIRQPNRYLGAARNTAAQAARGDFLLFLDDDNVARPELLSTLVRVAQRTGADIVTCLCDHFQGQEPPREILRRCLFAGDLGLVGIARNCFGDATALVRRAVFRQLGGFTEDAGICHEDWEFFARACLRGCRLEVVPESLFWYRLGPVSMTRSTPAGRNYARSLRPYLEESPAELHDLYRLAQGLTLENLRLREQLGLLRHRLADRVAGGLIRIPGLRQGLKRLARWLTGGEQP